MGRDVTHYPGMAFAYRVQQRLRRRHRNHYPRVTFRRHSDPFFLKAGFQLWKARPSLRTQYFAMIRRSLASVNADTSSDGGGRRLTVAMVWMTTASTGHSPYRTSGH